LPALSLPDRSGCSAAPCAPRPRNRPITTPLRKGVPIFARVPPFFYVGPMLHPFFSGQHIRPFSPPPVPPNIRLSPPTPRTPHITSSPLSAARFTSLPPKRLPATPTGLLPFFLSFPLPLQPPSFSPSEWFGHTLLGFVTFPQKPPSLPFHSPESRLINRDPATLPGSPVHPPPVFFPTG